jgi:EAL and modified HD-GYP domain-containing signal transduction protein
MNWSDKKKTVRDNPLRRKFVARQPIFDRDKKVVAYELLFRTSLDNFFDQLSGQDDASSKTLLDSFLLFDINELAGGKQVFINFTRKVLLSDAATAFPKERLVVELLESIEPEPVVIEACKQLKAAGYQIALDDFVFSPEFTPLMAFMDIVKVDFIDTSPEDCKNIFKKVDRQRIKFLAEKLETIESFNEARDLGYTYFQGFFFSKPVIMSAMDIPSVKANLLNLLHRVYQVETDFQEIEEIIKKDVSLAYKLIRFINSAAFGLSLEVHSIMHALNLLGVNELRKWISLVALSQLSHDEPEELMTSSIVRARFCELIAQYTGFADKSSEFFLMGLFSLIDVFFERPMAEVLKELPLTHTVKDALLEGDGVYGDVLKFVIAYERGEWQTLFDISGHLKLDEEIIPELYYETVTWANMLELGDTI